MILLWWFFQVLPLLFMMLNMWLSHCWHSSNFCNIWLTKPFSKWDPENLTKSLWQGQDVWTKLLLYHVIWQDWLVSRFVKIIFVYLFSTDSLTQCQYSWSKVGELAQMGHLLLLFFKADMFISPFVGVVFLLCSGVQSPLFLLLWRVILVLLLLWQSACLSSIFLKCSLCPEGVTNVS